LTGISFGIRNFEHLADCVKEINRVLKKGGRLIVIEMFRPEKKTIIHTIFDFYFSRMVPKLGNMISKSNYAYSYLFNSVNTFKSVSEYHSILKVSGFQIEYSKNNFLGIVNTVQAKKI
jgi:demethylmenaquinone methyltransferase / 2-methoxy-6-polyprenyl-1,4-benzoquinol methylase